MAADNTRGEMKAHEGTYLSFLSMLKMGTIITIIIAAIVVLLIAR